MTFNYLATGGIIGGLIVGLVTGFLGIQTPVRAVMVLAAYIGSIAVWWYSPLPNSNGGIMASQDRGMYWGFEKEDE
jgi:hypothetical protein